VTEFLAGNLLLYDLSLRTCQLVLNPSKSDAARAKGLEEIANILSRYSGRQTIYRVRYEGKSQPTITEDPDLWLTHREYRDALKELYVKVLAFQATIIVFLSENALKRISADMVM